MQYTLCISLTQRRSLFDFWLCFLLDALLMLIPLSFNVSITITIKNDISCLRLPAFLPSLSPLLTLHPVSCLSLLHVSHFFLSLTSSPVCYVLLFHYFSSLHLHEFNSETCHPVLLFPLQKFFSLHLSFSSVYHHHHPHRSVFESNSSLFYSPTLTLTEMSTVCFFFLYCH